MWDSAAENKDLAFCMRVWRSLLSARYLFMDLSHNFIILKMSYSLWFLVVIMLKHNILPEHYEPAIHVHTSRNLCSFDSEFTLISINNYLMTLVNTSKFHTIKFLIASRQQRMFVKLYDKCCRPPQYTYIPLVVKTKHHHLRKLLPQSNLYILENVYLFIFLLSPWYVIFAPVSEAEAKFSDWFSPTYVISFQYCARILYRTLYYFISEPFNSYVICPWSC